MNENGSSEWKRRQTPIDGNPDLISFSIRASNKVDTPQGEGVALLGLNCGGNVTFDSGVVTPAEVDGDEVKIGFDGAQLTQKTWHHFKKIEGSTSHSGHLGVPDDDQADFVRQLRKSKTFEFEFTSKSGKSQLSSFKLLNIASLMDQEKSCKSILDRSR